MSDMTAVLVAVTAFAVAAAALFLLVGVLLLGARTASDTATLHISTSVRPDLGERIPSDGGTRRWQQSTIATARQHRAPAIP